MFLSHSLATERVHDMKVGEIASHLRLGKSVEELGIEPYFTTETPFQKHWKLPQPTYDCDELPKRKVTSKTLADVIESTIAAAYFDGAMAIQMDHMLDMVTGESNKPQPCTVSIQNGGRQQRKCVVTSKGCNVSDCQEIRSIM